MQGPVRRAATAFERAFADEARLVDHFADDQDRERQEVRAAQAVACQPVRQVRLVQLLWFAGGLIDLCLTAIRLGGDTADDVGHRLRRHPVEGRQPRRELRPIPVLTSSPRIHRRVVAAFA